MNYVSKVYTVLNNCDIDVERIVLLPRIFDVVPGFAEQPRDVLGRSRQTGCVHASNYTVHQTRASIIVTTPHLCTRVPRKTREVDSDQITPLCLKHTFKIKLDYVGFVCF